jgi:antitoxin component YwqK of YwqJK toxin-antitoxin module
MAQKVHLPIKVIAIAVIVFVCFSACNKHFKEKDQPSFSLFVDISAIPKDTIGIENKNLILSNGVYYLHKKVFSGYIKEMYEKNQLKRIGSYLKGKQHGITLTYYSNGNIRDSRSYKNGKAYGKHSGYWGNGFRKFDFIYVNDKREGLQNQWYISGTPYCSLTFKSDKEEGMQKAWRENGKLYINYEARDGDRYGLQKSALCYTLMDGKLKPR